MVPRSTQREGAAPREAAQEQRGDEQMRAYYVKVFRQMFSTAVLTGFLSGGN
jgi:hypothetical protein